LHRKRANHKAEPASNLLSLGEAPDRGDRMLDGTMLNAVLVLMLATSILGRS
jgi:hypothetical protein